MQIPAKVSLNVFDENRAEADSISAHGSGGGMYSECSDILCLVQVLMNKLSKNRAERNGGGFH